MSSESDLDMSIACPLTGQAIDYPQHLPVSQRKDEILTTIRDNQVVIIAGETGSGKTTQIPKICLELGRGTTGLIGHTQPRRIAARTIAERVAEELGSSLGQVVGYQVRFSDRVGPDTRVKVMTDGILLAELPRDPSLRRYDTLIIDEAHERSLNIDVILGYITRLLPRRPDLKVIITSATIDSGRFSSHFGAAPVIEVSGRTYPVEVRYRPYAEDDDRDQTDAIRDAIEELRREKSGDILVFLSGEREIRETADVLAGAQWPHTEILPLYARLPAAEQHRVFSRSIGRRIVLATNVAETSLTVPGIRYVVDTGTARISRYSHRLKVQRLPIEPISQASANQRAGRCGRVADGICIRLYSQADYDARPEYTDPEILRTNLASVVLRMAAIGLGGIDKFPFIDPPDRRAVTDGVRLLDELGACDRDGAGAPRLTAMGKKLARLPIDPRFARMVIEADRLGCADDIVVIVAALSIQDPRERPTEQRESAEAAHARFLDRDSDFLSYVNLWRHINEQQQRLSKNQFRRLCRAEFLHYQRVREWQDLYNQIWRAARTLVSRGDGPESSGPQRLRDVHTALLAGLLSHVGMRDPDKRDFLGARGARFFVFPGSGLFKKQPRWVMAAELVETSRLWARVVGKVEPSWIEPLAGHLVKRSYSEPHWSRERGAVMAYEKVTLYGLPLVARRCVNYAAVDPVLCRELFIRHALVEGDWDTQHRFFQDNQALLADITRLEHRARTYGLCAEDAVLVDFYDARLPAEVVSARHFDSWWKKAKKVDSTLLTFQRSDVLSDRASGVDEDDYPDVWRYGDISFPLEYCFDPGTSRDGVTVRVPLSLLDHLPEDIFGWQVPGLREELITALIRSLPKRLRREIGPIPQVVSDLLARMKPCGDCLVTTMERELRDLIGLVIPHDAWDFDRVPEYLTVTYQVVDENDHLLAEGKNLDTLRKGLEPHLTDVMSQASATFQRKGLRSWDCGEIPRTLCLTGQGRSLVGYPALVDKGESVDLQVMRTPEAQHLAMHAGVRRLLALTTPSPVGFVNSRLSNKAKLVLSRHPHTSAADLLDDCVTCALDAIIAERGGFVMTQEEFTALGQATRAQLNPTTMAVVGHVQKALDIAHSLKGRLGSSFPPVAVPAVSDMREQLMRLIYRGFVTQTGWRWLPELPRYLQAIERRLDRFSQDIHRDAERMACVHRVQGEYNDRVRDVPSDRAMPSELVDIRWMIEEYRVNLFAQALGTAYPISDKRIYKAMDSIDPSSWRI